MRFASVCSGIGAPEYAWEKLGWSCLWASEIDPFARAVYASHYPNVPLYGDFTDLTEVQGGSGSVDVLVAGTPCQDFSVAGLRAGLAGTLPCASNTSDNEDATPALWYSEVLSVKNAVGEPIPEFAQAPKEESKRPSSVRRQDAGDVLPNQPPGANESNEIEKRDGESASIAGGRRTALSSSRELDGNERPALDRAADRACRIALTGEHGVNATSLIRQKVTENENPLVLIPSILA